MQLKKIYVNLQSKYHLELRCKMNIKTILIIIGLLPTVFANSQDRKLICLTGKVDRLVDITGEVFFEAPKEYEIINSDLNGYGGLNSFQQMNYHFTGFPILVRNRNNYNFCLMDQNKIASHFFYKKYSGVGRLHEGYYLASFKKIDGMLQETQYEFLDRFGQPIFNRNQGYRDASYFSEGLAPIKIWGKGWIFINDLGHELDFIPDSLGHMEWVHSFKDGRSLIKKVIYNHNSQSTIAPYFISKQGEVLLDVQNIFPDRKITNISEFQGGVAYVQFEMPKSPEYKGVPVVFIDSIGNIILDVDAAIDFKVVGNGFITFQKKLTDQKYVSEIYDKLGRKLNLPENVNQIEFLGENKYLIGCDIPLGRPNGKAKYYLFDAKSEKILQPYSGGDCLGIIDNMLIIKGANEEIVIRELSTEKVIYQSQLTDMKVTNLDAYKGKMEDISIFYCNKAEWLPRIKEMRNLKELTLTNLNINLLPELANPGILQLLRIDECRNLTALDMQINNVKQLSLRACLSLTNVKEFVKNQISLKDLYIINMDVSSSDISEIMKSYPKAVISGNAKFADYELQEVIYGF